MKETRPTKPKDKQKKQARPDTKVPEMAENMEHTLRRLARQKDKARTESPVQYLRK